MDARVPGEGTGLNARVRRWFLALARGRNPERLPVRLDRKRIYIVPTRAGLGFGLLLAVMLLGSLNYQNNAALMLTCLLGTALSGSMLFTWRELHGLRLQSVHAEHGFCPAPMPLQLTFADDHRLRPGMQVELGLGTRACPLGPGQNRARVAMPTTRRGWVSLPRLRLSTCTPFGLFHAWSWITPAQKVLVYPQVRPGKTAPPASHGSGERYAGGDELTGLRDYQVGDPIRHIAWKASARRDDLLVRQFNRGAPDQPLQLDWHAMPGIERELRISQLTGMLCEAFAQSRPWVLVLEDHRSLGPDADVAHFHRCLTSLAELP